MKETNLEGENQSGHLRYSDHNPVNGDNVVGFLEEISEEETERIIGHMESLMQDGMLGKMLQSILAERLTALGPAVFGKFIRDLSSDVILSYTPDNQDREVAEAMIGLGIYTVTTEDDNDADDDESDQSWIDQGWECAHCWLADAEDLLMPFGVTINGSELLTYWQRRFWPRVAVDCYLADVRDASLYCIDPLESDDWQADVRDARRDKPLPPQNHRDDIIRAIDGLLDAEGDVNEPG